MASGLTQTSSNSIDQEKKQIVLIDQTIREGMLFHGLVFSLEERLAMLDFQEALGIQISQVASPFAHQSEQEILNRLCRLASERAYHIRVAGHARALKDDVKGMVAIGCQNIHLHTGVNPVMLQRLGVRGVAENLEETVRIIRDELPEAHIKASMLDIGHSRAHDLTSLAHLMAHELRINIITLPDTSGVMLPFEYAERIKACLLAVSGSASQVSAHCHNDLGLAGANSLAGVQAGATAVEVSVFGIGERNGIADLALTVEILEKAGFDSGWSRMDRNGLSEYYQYVHRLILEKTGLSMIHYATPMWGKGVATMGAGSHGIGEYGVRPSTDFFLNHMCGRSLVKRFLQAHHLSCSDSDLPALVQQIKNLSVEKQRALTRAEVETLIPSN